MIGDSIGPLSVLSISMLYAENGGRDCRPFLDQVHGLGIEAGRWFASPLTPNDTRTGQTLAEAEARAPRIAGYLEERHMWGDAVGFCDTGAWSEWDAHADWFGQFLDAHPWLIGEGGNELGHQSQALRPEDVARLVERIRARYHGVLTAGAWVEHDELFPDETGTYWPAGIRGCDVADTHFTRGPELAWDNASHGFSELRKVAMKYQVARKSGEPQRTDDGVMPPQVFAYLLGLKAQGFNTWSTLHCSQARDVQVLSGGQLEDVKAFLRGGHAIPRGRYHFENAGWGGSPVKSAAFVEGPASNPAQTVWRAHSYQNVATGQWFLDLSGPNVTQPFLVFQHGFELDQKVDALGQYAEVWTLKQG